MGSETGPSPEGGQPDETKFDAMEAEAQAQGPAAEKRRQEMAGWSEAVGKYEGQEPETWVTDKETGEKHRVTSNMWHETSAPKPTVLGVEDDDFPETGEMQRITPTDRGVEVDTVPPGQNSITRSEHYRSPGSIAEDEEETREMGPTYGK